jgi:ATP-dependent Clp protease ATP-binding subunit ClpA
MTSNAGARDIGRQKVGFSSEVMVNVNAAQNAVNQIFSPEFRNRLDSVVTFNGLSEENILLIVKKNMDEFAQQLKGKGVTLDISEGCIAWLARKGYSPEFGAREIARLIQDRIKTRFVDEVLFGALKNGGRARIEVNGEEIEFMLGDI